MPGDVQSVLKIRQRGFWGAGLNEGIPQGERRELAAIDGVAPQSGLVRSDIVGKCGRPILLEDVSQCDVAVVLGEHVVLITFVPLPIQLQRLVEKLAGGGCLPSLCSY